MKNFIFIILIILISSVFIKFTNEPDNYFEIIEVVDTDKFYIDLNKNSKPDYNELFKLQGISAFPLKFNYRTKFYAEKFNITPDEVLQMGYLAYEFSKKEFLNKKVKFKMPPQKYNPNFEYRYATLTFDNKDIAQILLDEGFANVNYRNFGIFYIKFENKEKVKQNAKLSNNMNFVIVDTINNKYYDPKCPVKYKIKDAIFMPFDILDKNKFKKGEFCSFEKQNFEDKIESKTPQFSVKNLDLFLINPNKYKFPSKKCRTNYCQTLIYNIKNSKNTIDIAIYGIENQENIIKELQNAKNRGVKIRIVSDKDKEGKCYYKDTPRLEKITDIKYDNKNHIMHNKFFIFDNQKVLTGSVNLSSTGSGGYNSNSAILIDNKTIAKAYKNEFEQMFSGKFQKQKTENYSIQNIKINENTSVDIFFSPKGNLYENAISPIIQNAKKKIYIDVFYLTHKGIIEDLINAKKKGVDIKIIIDAASANNSKNKITQLRGEGIKVKVENWGGKAHEKTLMADDNILIIGSANFTQSAMTYNDENIVIIKNKNIANVYEKFFLNLYNSIDNIYLTKNPSAEGFSSKNSCFDGIDNNFDGKIDKDDKNCKMKK